MGHDITVNEEQMGHDVTVNEASIGNETSNWHDTSNDA